MATTTSAGRRRLKIRQLDTHLSEMTALRRVGRPRGGWLREIRTALGMTTSQLARRLGLTTSSVTHLERSEREDTITLASLRKAAAAMNCELVYAIMPKKPLRETLEQQAIEIARQQTHRVSHSMRLEEQGISPEAETLLVRDLAEELLTRRPKSLWE
jgi:predicted DNA-binding mobile mystery protein A